MSAQVISSSNLECLEREFARAWVEVYLELAKANSYVVGGWCGGNSPKALFPALLSELSQIEPALREKHRVMLVDERLYEEPNEEMLEEHLIAPGVARGLLKREQALMYPRELADSPDHGVSCYLNTLRGVGGRFNYVVLGSGYPHSRSQSGEIENYDCHCAGTFAHHASTTSAQAREPGFFYYYDSPKPPPGRITATQPLLEAADVGFLLILGQAKWPVLDEYLDPNVALEDCPVKILRSIKQRIIVTDRVVTQQEVAAA